MNTSACLRLACGNITCMARLTLLSQTCVGRGSRLNAAPVQYECNMSGKAAKDDTRSWSSRSFRSAVRSDVKKRRRTGLLLLENKTGKQRMWDEKYHRSILSCPTQILFVYIHSDNEQCSIHSQWSFWLWRSCVHSNYMSSLAMAEERRPNKMKWIQMSCKRPITFLLTAPTQQKISTCKGWSFNAIEAVCDKQQTLQFSRYSWCHNWQEIWHYLKQNFSTVMRSETTQTLSIADCEFSPPLNRKTV